MSSKIRARQVFFALFHGDKELVRGNFIVTTSLGQSCFGDYRRVTFTNIEGPENFGDLFEGAILDHVLEPDGSAKVGFLYYAVRPSDETGFGKAQLLEVKASLSMGPESGTEKNESVMLGHEHEFVFRSRAVA